MKALGYCLVESDTEYNNEKSLSSGVSLVVNTTVESVAHINRIVRLVSAPEGTVLLPGDELIIHHNILRTVNALGGAAVKSEYWVEGNIYYVPLTEIFAYRRGEDWISLDPYCFVKPVAEDTKVSEVIDVSHGTFNKELSHKGMKKLKGLMWYPNKSLEFQGVVRGDEVVFSKDSEYEFEIEGQVYYKMKTSDVLAIK